MVWRIVEDSKVRRALWLLARRNRLVAPGEEYVCSVCLAPLNRVSYQLDEASNERSVEDAGVWEISRAEGGLKDRQLFCITTWMPHNA